LEDLEFAAVERRLGMLGVQTLAEWDVLIFLNRHPFSLFGADTIPSLAGYSGDLSSVALSSLERLGLIKRFRADPNHDVCTPATLEPARKMALNYLMNLAGDRIVRLALIGQPARPMRPPPGTPARPVVVGLCGSAGSLEALREIFSRLPVDTDMAFVVVQHISPHRASTLVPAILSRVTAMTVAEIEQDITIQPNRVFVIPPNSDLVIEGGLLHLAPRTVDRYYRHRSIDTFLISLANDRRSAAISVILSGMDKDGIMGTAAIKKGGGITMAQRVDTAQEQALPRNVINDGQVDFVESPQGIAQLLVQFSRT